MSQSPLLEVKGLTKHFGRIPQLVRALEEVSLCVASGEVVGLVGESGSGKSTVGRLVLRSIDPTAGQVIFNGTDITSASTMEMKPYRRQMQMVFQDPYASLNPRLRVGEIVGEALDAHHLTPNRSVRKDRISELLSIVGLPSEYADRFPNEFSGGQRQRIGIARALAVDPKLIVADEPVSALDVSVQAQVLNLLQDLRSSFGLAMLFISHDLDVVELMCDRIVVLYLGRVMEVGPASGVCTSPRHPYTRALMAASPRPDPGFQRVRQTLQGDIPSPISPPSGCVFRTRCPMALPVCTDIVPMLRPVGANHSFSCIRDDL